MHRIVVLLAIVLGVACPSAARADDYTPPLKWIKGFSWGWVGARGEYLGDKPEQSLDALSATGTEWIALCFAAHMDTKSSPTIRYGERNDFMVSDDEIRRAIQIARKRNLKVIMKPVVNCQDGTWRAEIALDSDEEWDRWWRSYRGMMLHYAAIASEEGCELYCAGCEMRSTEGFADRWRGLIADLRKVFSKPIIYNANHDDIERIAWFDAIDVIGVSAYYPVAAPNDTSLERMLAGWKPVRDKLRGVSRRWEKPILFMEVGVRSAKTCSSMPWDWAHKDLPYDGEEQARYYEAAFQTFHDEPWFLGYCWWDWKAHLDARDEAHKNLDFGVYGKPAEDVLRKWYSKNR